MDFEISKGYFPKVGQTKKFFVEGLGYLELTGKEYEGGGEGEKEWVVKGLFNDFTFFEETEWDYPRVSISIVGKIWLQYVRDFKRWEKKYISEITDVFVNGEKVMVETGNKEFVHGGYEPIMKPLKIPNWFGEDTQKNVLEKIIKKTLKEIYPLFLEYRPSQQKDEDENEEVEPIPQSQKGKSKIPFIGGIAAIIGSAFFLKSRLK